MYYEQTPSFSGIVLHTFLIICPHMRNQNQTQITIVCMILCPQVSIIAVWCLLLRLNTSILLAFFLFILNVGGGSASPQSSAPSDCRVFWLGWILGGEGGQRCPHFPGRRFTATETSSDQSWQTRHCQPPAGLFSLAIARQMITEWLTHLLGTGTGPKHQVGGEEHQKLVMHAQKQQMLLFHGLDGVLLWIPP